MDNNIYPINKFNKKYKILETLGKSYTALIKKVKCNKTNNIYVAKIIYKNKIGDYIYREYNILKNIKDIKYTPILYNTYEDDKYLVLIIQMYIKPDLADYLFNNDVLCEYKVKFIIFSTLKILHNLHKNNVIHMDIKPENLMFDYNRNLNIIDFGLSSFINSADYKCNGTLYYLSPEIIIKLIKDKNQEINYVTDIWSLGITMYVLLFKKYPFFSNKKDELLNLIINHPFNNKNNSELNKLSPNAQNFLFNCLIKNYKDRPTAYSLLQHKWFI